MVFIENRNEQRESFKGSRAVSQNSLDKDQAILNAMHQNSKVTAAEIAIQLGISSRAVEKRIRAMRENGIIRRIGPDKGGFWEITNL